MSQKTVRSCVFLTSKLFLFRPKESEMMLEWSAEQGTEIITREAIDLEFLPTNTNVERGLQNLEFALQQMHTAKKALTSTKPTTLSPSRGRILREPGDDYRSDTIQRQEEGNETSCVRSLLQNSPGTSRRHRAMGVLRVALREEAEEQAGWRDPARRSEALVPGELEKHLILNSNSLRTFEDARLEVVTYVEAKFGLIIRDAKPGETTPWVHSDPMDVDAVNSLSSCKGESFDESQWRVLYVRRCSLSTPLRCMQRQEQAIVWQR